ncbi:MAG: hypothetical protein WDM76_00800 [Limisphaerales bacterium]
MKNSVGFSSRRPLTVMSISRSMKISRPTLIAKYSRLERVEEAAKLEHPIIREAFALIGLDGRGLELSSMADIPAGTGLGSSGSFTTALLKALHAHKTRFDSSRRTCGASM